MKKLLAMAMMAVMMLTFAGCGNSTGADDVQPAAQGVSTGSMEILERGSSEAVRNSVAVTEAVSSAAPESEKTTQAATEADVKSETAAKSLVVYFSWSGNTEKVAQEIQKQTGADIFRIVPSTPYTDDYNELLNVAQQEKKSNARPQIAGSVPDFRQYDTIYFGYPNWWASIPMPIASFLEEYDFSGKTIIPFCSHGGGRFGQSLTAITKLAPAAKMGEALSIHYSGGDSMSSDVSDWLKKNGISKDTVTKEMQTEAQTKEPDVIKAEQEKSTSATAQRRISLDVEGTKLTATLYDTPTANALYERLPLDLTFEDFNGIEKISYLTDKLPTQGEPDGCDPDVGDLCLYAPWGNLSIFYNDFRYSESLIMLGHIDGGMGVISGKTGNFHVRIEAVQ